MNFYWVNIGTSKNIVKEHGFLWAPQKVIKENGTKAKNAGWEQVKSIVKGDVIFCYFDKRIHYIAVATKDSYVSSRPSFDEFKAWAQNATDDGTRVDIDVQILENSLDSEQFKEEVIDYYNEQCTPVLFTKKKSINQQYMISLSKSVGILILNSIGDESIRTQEIITKNNSTSKNKKKPKKTTKETLIQARVGHGAFRDELLEYWKSCPVTDVNDSALLIASHILPWHVANDDEKLDKFNGILLSPSVDKLFDRGYISFDDQGKLLTHKKLNIKNLDKLGIEKNAQIKGLEKAHLYYLNEHREIFGFNK